MSDPQTITRLLRRWRGGEEGALESLIPLVYEELRRIARQLFSSERAGHTLQPTAVLHEAYARLVDAGVDWNDRTHFYAVAARAMRRVLLDHARRKGAARHGGDWHRASVDVGESVAGSEPIDILLLDKALQRLESRDPRAARAAEMHYFGGMEWDAIAEALDVSRSTVARDLRVAKAWLVREISGGGPEAD
jgi:RNA polymerase sigma factor (TIGR02999 family)